MKQEIIEFINKKYNVAPEYLWRRYPSFCVFRHAKNKKWFAIIMTVPWRVLKLPGDGTVNIMNIKTDNTEFFLGVPGILPAYHMNKNHWVSVLLDGTLPIANVKKILDLSHDITE